MSILNIAVIFDWFLFWIRGRYALLPGSCSIQMSTLTPSSTAGCLIVLSFSWGFSSKTHYAKYVVIRRLSSRLRRQQYNMGLWQVWFCQRIKSNTILRTCQADRTGNKHLRKTNFKHMTSTMHFQRLANLYPVCRPIKYQIKQPKALHLQKELWTLPVVKFHNPNLYGLLEVLWIPKEIPQKALDVRSIHQFLVKCINQSQAITVQKTFA